MSFKEEIQSEIDYMLNFSQDLKTSKLFSILKYSNQGTHPPHPAQRPVHFPVNPRPRLHPNPAHISQIRGRSGAQVLPLDRVHVVLLPRILFGAAQADFISIDQLDGTLRFQKPARLTPSTNCADRADPAVLFVVEQRVLYKILFEEQGENRGGVDQACFAK